MSWQGMPTCVFCKHRFWGWPEFNLHVAYLQCPGLRSHKATHGEQFHLMPPPDSDHKPDPEIQARLTKGNWFHIIRLPHVREALANHCPICDKYLLQSAYIKGHAELLSHCDYPPLGRVFGAGKTLKGGTPTSDIVLPLVCVC